MLKAKASIARRPTRIPAPEGRRPAAWTLVDEYARQQGVKPLMDPKVLEGGFPADEDIDAFLEVIYRNRK
jgi:hypothetical protein